MVIHACNPSATELTQEYCQFGDQPGREAEGGRDRLCLKKAIERD